MARIGRRSWSELTQRYDSTTNDQFQGNQGANHDHDQLLAEIARLGSERDHLEPSCGARPEKTCRRPQASQSLAIWSRRWSTLGKVREMKDKLLEEQLGESHHRLQFYFHIPLCFFCLVCFPISILEVRVDAGV
ncbi:hypothetical protein ZWY2020_043885 [Hordeum vulgare]|nr:hypothetical protein ZWY2020_043885 [Hordeum vulgare]